MVVELGDPKGYSANDDRSGTWGKISETTVEVFDVSPCSRTLVGEDLGATKTKQHKTSQGPRDASSKEAMVVDSGRRCSAA